MATDTRVPQSGQTRIKTSILQCGGVGTSDGETCKVSTKVDADVCSRESAALKLDGAGVL